MTNTKHTPGPWEISYLTGKHWENLYIESPKDGAGSFIRIDAIGNVPEQEANAHLIAAAPDMLEALKRVENEWASDDWTSLMKAIKDVIAKAEGAQQ